MAKKKHKKVAPNNGCFGNKNKSVKNIVIICLKDRYTDMCADGLVKFDTEKEAFDFSRKFIADMRAQGETAIASPIDEKTLKELVAKGVVTNEWYDPDSKEYCTVNRIA